MPTYRLYKAGRTDNIEFNGDDMAQTGQFVQILTDNRARVAVAFHLEPGWYVADVNALGRSKQPPSDPRILASRKT